MNMVKFINVTLEESIAVIYFQEREEIFKAENDCSNIVPYYVLIEAIFQTAGRVAREYSNNIYGGIIASFSDFCFSRPVFTDELLTIKAKILSYNDKAKVFYFRISLHGEDDVILPNGVILIKQEKIISSEYLNNSINKSVELNLKEIGYVKTAQSGESSVT